MVERQTDKYPKTWYAPWSPSVGGGDKVVEDADLQGFYNDRLVVTEKLDGSNVCLTCDSLFARSHSGSPTHASFDPLKALHAQIKHKIPINVALFGEWCYAKHSIHYTELPGYLFLFQAQLLTATREFLEWPRVREFARLIGVNHVPLLYEAWHGEVTNKDQLQRFMQTAYDKTPSFGKEKEGVVLRRWARIKPSRFSKETMKMVRPNHIQTDEHWTNQPIVKNILKV